MTEGEGETAAHHILLGEDWMTFRGGALICQPVAENTVSGITGEEKTVGSRHEKREGKRGTSENSTAS